VLNQLYDGAYAAGAQAAADVLGEAVPVPEAFELDDLYATGEAVWQRIAAWTSDEIATAVTDGLKDSTTTVSKLAETIGGILDNPDRAFTVAQTEVTRAMTTAARDTYQRFGSKQIEFLSANDGKVCPACDANEDQGAIPIGDTFKNGMPPVHPRCLPGDTLVSTRSRITAATSRVYDGDLVSIRTLSGQHLRSTPNHPVLTDQGWLLAGLLEPGDKVVRALVEQGPLVGDQNDQDMPAAIEQVAESFLGSGDVSAAEVPVSAEDFHGDGSGSEVAVVGTYRGLLPEGHVACEQHVSEHGLQRTDMASTLLPAEGQPALLVEPYGSASGGVMGGGRESGSFGAVGVGHACVHGGAAVSRFDTSAQQTAADGRAADGVALAECLLADPGLVELDELVDVQRVSFHGLVFNLETDDGWYFGNTIVTHNCRCTVLPAN
jgi:hypothetical protein